ncbi:MAG: Arc family DNA-binding protein [Hungatella hathewayi]|nr:Arc family DNA-binding protein [Hungatella hathewayi]
MDRIINFSLRMDAEMHRKLKSLSEFEGRSINGEVLYLIRQAIAKHEKEYGPIE